MSEDTRARADDAADAQHDAAENEEHPSRRKSIGLFLRDVAIIVVAAIVISFLIKTFLVRSFFIPSESMEDTLLVNDRILVNQLVPELAGVERGDVIVFTDPGGWLDPVYSPPKDPVSGFFEWFGSLVGLTAPDSNDHLIKRVIGLPGDHIVCCNDFGSLSVNGVALDESPYVKLPSGISKVSRDDFEVTVPEGSLWVMGDNRWNSRDSRYNRDKPGDGFVPIDNVVGRAILISWPIDRWSWLDNYPLVFDGVDDALTTPTPDPSGVSDEPEPTDDEVSEE